MSNVTSRRGFLRATSGAVVGAIACAGRRTLAADAANAGPRLRKAVKFDMIKLDAPIEKKFELIKSLGFEGVEMNSPSGVNREEAVAAKKKTGIDIHGVVDSVHWDQRLSDPDEAVRARGLAALRTAIDDCKFYGGTTVLLVPGRVADPQK